MPLRRLGALAASVVLVPPLATLALPGTAHAVGETCDGKPVTLLISPEADPVGFGTEGNDVVLVTASDTLTFHGFGGADTICGGAGTTVVGGAGDDTILLGDGGLLGASGGPGDDIIRGGSGDDALVGGIGNDVLDGAGGDDGIIGSSGDDQVLGGDGDDEVSGGIFFENSALRGFPDEVVTAVPGVDTVDGGDGDDLVFDTDSDETLSGGPGQDTLSLHLVAFDDPEGCGFRADSAPLVDIAAQTVIGFGTDTFSGFETYRGGPYRQTFVGGPGPDDLVGSYCGSAHMLGRGGDDTIQVVGCDDFVNGGRGADSVRFSLLGDGTVRLGPGDDRITVFQPDDYVCGTPTSFAGGPGTDWLELGTEPSGIGRVDLLRGVAELGGEHMDLSGLENVREDDHNISGHHLFRVTGTDGPNVLIGGKGRTILDGRGGNDVLLGGKGLDTAFGGPGRDRCQAEVRRACEAR